VDSPAAERRQRIPEADLHRGDLLAWEAAQAEQPVPKPRILEHHDHALAALAQKRAERNPRLRKGAPTSPEI